MADQSFYGEPHAAESDREHLERFRTLAELGADLAFTLNFHLDGTASWDWVSPTVRVPGFQRDSLPLDGAFMETVHPEDQPVAAMWLGELQRTREATAEFRLVAGESERILRVRGRCMWSETEHRVTQIHAAAEDVTERHQATKALQQRALYDYLTDLPNRALMLDRLRQTIRESSRRGSTFALLMFDMNRFKLINDTFGHSAGDRVLQEVARRLTQTLRASDTIARLGGDEFAVLLTRLEEPDHLNAVLNRIVGSLLPPLAFGDTTLQLRASIGVAMYPKDGQNSDVLIRCADTAMYVSKRLGTDWEFYHPDQELGSAKRLSLLANLRKAIDEDKLSMFYLPEMHMRSGNVTWVEALLRWQHPTHGLLSPAEFIPIAEQHGHILQLTTWSLRHALEQLAAWRRAGFSLGVAVNLSPKVLKLPSFTPELKAILAEAGVAPNLLKLEINESALMSDTELVASAVAGLRELGVYIAVDDFGQQYSSLSYLRQLQVNELKIDRTYVRDMQLDAYNAAVVQSTIALAHQLGIHVVAEGVETRDIWQAVDDLDCDLVQGFYLSKPLPAPGGATAIEQIGNARSTLC